MNINQRNRTLLTVDIIIPLKRSKVSINKLWEIMFELTGSQDIGGYANLNHICLYQQWTI